MHAFQMEVKFGYAIPVLWRGKLTPEMLDSKKVLIFHDGDKQFVWQVNNSIALSSKLWPHLPKIQLA